MPKCADCGFLAVRLRADYSTIVEASEEFREQGLFLDGVYAYGPFCFMRRRKPDDEHTALWRAYEQTAERDPLGGYDQHAQDRIWLEVLHKEYDCSDWTRWRSGFTPKEHRDMIDREFMLELDRKERASNRRWRMMEFAAVVVGLVLVVAAAFIERGGQPTINNVINYPAAPSVTPAPTP